jgi:hypothetical protein
MYIAIEPLVTICHWLGVFIQLGDLSLWIFAGIVNAAFWTAGFFLLFETVQALAGLEKRAPRMSTPL